MVERARLGQIESKDKVADALIGEIGKQILAEMVRPIKV